MENLINRKDLKMPRKQKYNAIQCQYFIWRLFPRNGVWYADGRSGEYDLGKHSLGTRDKIEAEKALLQLDHMKAVEFGIIDSDEITNYLEEKISIEKGVQLFYEDRNKDTLFGGVTKTTLKRYRAVINKFKEFCVQKKKYCWEECSGPQKLDSVLRYKITEITVI